MCIINFLYDIAPACHSKERKHSIVEFTFYYVVIIRKETLSLISYLPVSTSFSQVIFRQKIVGTLWEGLINKNIARNDFTPTTYALALAQAQGVSLQLL